ncbi:LOW QUALITY PROTEIN: neuronal PAS domain-containing protein 2 [Pyxicephalus adspersus]|uniref:LOW QUALITY PROTEIN: neuronal PAS domain-containing protein 2 n=1 Tax=Pyxicephalus adspersus TaxID=30357 RepID=UPI003B59D786
MRYSGCKAKATAKGSPSDGVAAQGTDIAGSLRSAPAQLASADSSTVRSGKRRLRNSLPSRRRSAARKNSLEKLMDEDEKDRAKRASRNRSEKKRRDQFNVLIKELSTMLPGNTRKMDKTTVLEKVIGFLQKHNDTVIAVPISSCNGYEGAVSRTYRSQLNKQVCFIATVRLATPQFLKPGTDVIVLWLPVTLWAPPIIGYLPFEVLGTSGYDYYHVDDLEIIAKCHEHLMQFGKGKSCCYRFLTKGQQWIWLQTHYYITYHQWNSKPEFIVCTHTVVSYADVRVERRQKASLDETPSEVVARSALKDKDLNMDSDQHYNVLEVSASLLSPCRTPSVSSRSSHKSSQTPVLEPAGELANVGRYLCNLFVCKTPAESCKAEIGKSMSFSNMQQAELQQQQMHQQSGMQQQQQLMSSSSASGQITSSTSQGLVSSEPMLADTNVLPNKGQKSMSSLQGIQNRSQSTSTNSSQLSSSTGLLQNMDTASSSGSQQESNRCQRAQDLTHDRQLRLLLSQPIQPMMPSPCSTRRYSDSGHQIKFSQNPQVFRGLEVQTSASNAPIVLMSQAILHPGFTPIHSSQQQNIQAMQAQQHQQQFSQVATPSTLQKEQPDSLILPTYSQHQGSIGLQQQVQPQRTSSLSETSGVQ